MVQLVCGWSHALEYSHAKTLASRIAPGVHHFRSVAVPLNVSGIERRAVGWIERGWVVRVAFRGEGELPHPHDGVAVPIAVAVIVLIDNLRRASFVRNRYQVRQLQKGSERRLAVNRKPAIGASCVCADA